MINYKTLSRICFIEGGVLMAYELIVAKLIAPYYGNTVLVWSATLSSALLSLALGYYLGSTFESPHKCRKILQKVLLAASISLFSIPFWKNYLLDFSLNLPLEAGIILSTALFSLFVITFLGMVVPLSITILSSNPQETGKFTGKFFAQSTLGGIVFLVIFGFAIIPFLGLKISLFTCSGLMFICWLLSLQANRN